MGGTAVVIGVGVVGGFDLFFEGDAAEFEEDGGDAPDHEIEKGVALEVGEEWA